MTVTTAYNSDGYVASITAFNSVTGNQTTQYVYGTTLSDSSLASSLLKRKEIYPDSVDSDDVISFKYNRQGEVVEVQDQNGTVHNFDFDLLGRKTQDRVTTLGTSVDATIRRIASSYEVRGMHEKITSWSGEIVGSGSVVNEVQFAYNDFAQITADYQSHSGTVNTSTTPKVQRAYDSGADNQIRPTSLTYPNGRALNYNYSSASSLPDSASRIASLIDDDGTTHLSDYSYLGSITFVETDYAQPDTKYTLIGTAGGDDPDTGDIYRGLDRYGRIKDSYWYNYGTPTDTDRIKYGYDRNGNRTYRDNLVATAAGAYFDESYTNDLLDRLKNMDRGRLNAQKDGITNKTFGQCWSLDATGNWRNFFEDSNGDGTWDLAQVRVSNPVNEITGITNTSGAAWVTPAYNRAGNMTTIPKPADSTTSFTGTYDAWNRLVKLEDNSGIVAEYEYDGVKRMGVLKSYAAGVLSETRHLYYTEPSRWQVIEERLGSSPASAAAERQFVWGMRYQDDLVLRDRDTDGNGSLDERLYSLQDANWNVTSIVNAASSVQERYSYSAYGVPTQLNAAFSPQNTSSYAWETAFAGYRYITQSRLYHIRNRAYLTQVGVWLTRDPITYSGEYNLFEYCNSRPLYAVDPNGSEWWNPFTWWGAVCKPAKKGYKVYKDCKEAIEPIEEFVDVVGDVRKVFNCDAFITKLTQLEQVCNEEIADINNMLKWGEKCPEQISPIINPASPKHAEICCILHKAHDDPEVDFEEFKNGFVTCSEVLQLGFKWAKKLYNIPF